MKIYLAHPISGLGYDEIYEYYTNLRDGLRIWGYDVLQPMTGKEYLRNEVKFKTVGYDNPVSTNHAIVGRDTWMVRQADIVLVDFSAAEAVSIGCVSELAMAHVLGKHTVVVLPEVNVHRHAFVLDMAHIIFTNIEDAIKYLYKLAHQEF